MPTTTKDIADMTVNGMMALAPEHRVELLRHTSQVFINAAADFPSWTPDALIRLLERYLADVRERLAQIAMSGDVAGHA
jgi:hypothetical protein